MTYRIFEWVCDELPRFVAYGKGDSPWLTHWERRHRADNRLNRWLCGLDDPPELSWRWLPNTSIRIVTARGLYTRRLSQIHRWCGGTPEWLLNHVGRRCRPCMRRRGTETVLYDSARQAARREAVRDVTILERLTTGRIDSDGWEWFDRL